MQIKNIVTEGSLLLKWRVTLKVLIIFTIIVNGVGLFFPILRNDDPVLYANIAKNIVLSNDWINLTFLGHDWLDKPHFPFWVTALSFKIFGINSFAYIFPGFLFHVLGGYYTYRLACRLYNIDIGLLSALFYFSTLRLLFSSIDVRAEAYLLGMIMPACYYWYTYAHSSPNFKRGLFGAFFTALAVMTKGVFVLIPIFSGIIALCFVRSRTLNMSLFKRSCIKIVWIGLLIILLIMPEIISLYLQFDAHPEKVVFLKTNVSGIRWFFWDSQFGRFFNHGPISRHDTSGIFHYFYFMHTFLWAFLPWSVFFVLALYGMFKSGYRKLTITQYYLLWSFFPTFIMFSLTSFQLDYYTNIIIPFAAIICANWIYHKKSVDSLNETLLPFSRMRHIIIYLTIFINVIFLLATTFQGMVYKKYDTGYQIAQYLNSMQKLPVLNYQINSLTLEFYLDNYDNDHQGKGLINNGSYMRVGIQQEMLDVLKNPPFHDAEFYLVIPQNEVSSTINILQQYKYSAKSVKNIYGATIDKVIPNLIRNTAPQSSWLTAYEILYVEKHQ